MLLLFQEIHFLLLELSTRQQSFTIRSKTKTYTVCATFQEVKKNKKNPKTKTLIFVKNKFPLIQIFLLITATQISRIVTQFKSYNTSCKSIFKYTTAVANLTFPLPETARKSWIVVMSSTASVNSRTSFSQASLKTSMFSWATLDLGRAESTRAALITCHRKEINSHKEGRKCFI